jgi:prepilin-type processing-associated H-X9-DG protein
MEHFEIGDTAFLAGDALQTIICGTEDGLVTGPDDDDDEKFGGPHSGIVHFVYLDGHVGALQTSIEARSLVALSSIVGGEVVQP